MDSKGIITTIIGNGIQGFSGDGGPATGARLNGPRCVFRDRMGNLYIGDTFNHRIRKVAPIAAPPDTIQVAEVVAQPGGKAVVEVTLSTTHIVSDVQFTVQPSCDGTPTCLARFNTLHNDLDDLGFTVSVSTDREGLTTVGLCGMKAARLEPGWHTLLHLVYDLDHVTPDGTWIALVVRDTTLSDPTGLTIPHVLHAGKLHVARSGDRIGEPLEKRGT